MSKLFIRDHLQLICIRNARMAFFEISDDTPRRVLAGIVFFMVIWIPVTEMIPYNYDILCWTRTWELGKNGTLTLNLCLWNGKDHSVLASLTQKFWSCHVYWITWWLVKLFMYTRRRQAAVVSESLPSEEEVIFEVFDDASQEVRDTGHAHSEPLYRPLGDSEIRLLYLDCASKRGTLTGRIHIVNLKTEPKFEALSYVWGQTPSPSTTQIKINGSFRVIRPNLWAALRQLRANGYTGGLWADSVCINQDDRLERASQVKLMADIYHSARRVIVWLGESGTDGERGMTMLSILTDADTDATQTGVLSIARTILYEPRRPLSELAGDKARHQEGWTALAALLSRPYWARLWVVQEVLLSRSPMIMCGNLQVPWNTFAQCLNRLRYAALWDKPNGTENAVINSNDFKRIIGLITRHRRTHTVVSRASRFVHQRPARRTAAVDFLQMAKMCRGRAASDARDLVYGLLGIAPLHIDVDYRAIKVAVYTRAAKEVITSTRSLDVLSACTFDGAIGADYRWPSWVPDWSTQSASGDLGYTPFFSAGNSEATVSFDVEDVLVVKGLAVDAVKTVRHTDPVTSFEGLVQQNMQEWDWCTNNLGNRVEQKRLQVSFMKTLIVKLGELPPSGRKNAPQCPASPDFWPWNSALGWSGPTIKSTALRVSVSPRINELMRSMNSFTRNTASFLFCTVDERIGCGPGCALPGDIIAVIFGAKTPFLLRPAGDHYILIGHCFIDGLMFGEALTSSKIESQIFKIT